MYTDKNGIIALFLEHAVPTRGVFTGDCNIFSTTLCGVRSPLFRV